MTATNAFFCFIIALVASMLLTWVVKKRAHASARLDMPNHRSSHTIPTPTGGGLGIAIVVLSAVLWQFSIQPNSGLLCMLVGGFVLAVIGWLDDRSPISSRFRLIVQLILAAGVLYLANPFQLQGHNLWLATIVLAIPAVWLINLYNFMDGTDGLAAMQAIIFAVGWLVLNSIEPETVRAPNFEIIVIALLSAVLGFLVFNWPPATIFMGDVGSTFIGFLLVILLAFNCQSLSQLAAGLILLAGFITDASWTIGVRLLSGQKFWQPHRSHAYQKMSRSYQSHKAPLYWYLTTGFLIQWPLAYTAYHNAGIGWLCALTLAAAIHGFLCFKFKAGLVDTNSKSQLNITGNGRQC